MYLISKFLQVSITPDDGLWFRPTYEYLTHFHSFDISKRTKQ